MAPSIHELIADTDCVALTFRRTLEPLEGRDVPLFPPTYPPARETKKHRFDTPYTLNETADGVRICDLDSVQSQANRMEAAFTDGLLERERLDVLALTAHVLIDRHGALADWLARGSDPTVRVRDPAEHPGVPFGFVPFVATHIDALDALSNGALLAEAAAHASAELERYQRTQHRSPH